MFLYLKGRKETESTRPIPNFVSGAPAWERLEDQIVWYERRSKEAQWLHKAGKIFQLLLASSIPIVSLMPISNSKYLVAVAGALIALVEAVQHLNQWPILWLDYRSAAERLKHEKYLFLAAAGPYRGISETERLCQLAERVEEHVSAEHANWVSEIKKLKDHDLKEGSR